MSGVILPYVEEKLYELPQTIPFEEDNFFHGSLVTEWENVKDNLNVKNNYGLKLMNFRTVIRNDGTYELLEMRIQENLHEYTVSYAINLSDDGKRLEVSRHKFKTEDSFWSYNEQYLEAEFILDKIDLITEPMLHEHGMKSYEIMTDGQRVNYGVRNNIKYQIDTAGKHRLDNSDLPVNGIMASVCGSNKGLNEHGYIDQCDSSMDFILDLIKEDASLVLQEDTLLSVARNHSSEIDHWLREHSGTHIAEEREGDYVLIKDGVEEIVSFESYAKELSDTPKMQLNFDEGKQQWEVRVSNRFGNAPHTMEFTIHNETKEINNLQFY